MVCAVTRELEEAVRDIEGCVLDDEVPEEDDFNRATRWAVAGSKADICIGGKFTGDLGFLGSVEDRV